MEVTTKYVTNKLKKMMQKELNRNTWRENLHVN